MYEIGKIYEVPCFVYFDRWYGKASLPIYNHQHNDSEIDVSHNHYHVDFRFIKENPKFIRKIYKENNNKFALFTLPINRCETNYEIKKFPRMYYGNRDFGYYHNIQNLERPTRSVTSIGMKYNKQNDICPHKGFSLKDVPVINGCKTCPLHLFKWHIETGKPVIKGSLVL